MSNSIYTSKIVDQRAEDLAAYSGLFRRRRDGSFDITKALQAAINTVKTKFNWGLVLIGPGTYYISQTIYIPKAVRVLGYGEERPLIILEKDSPGFQKSDALGDEEEKFMFWFTNSIPNAEGAFKDANAGTFYSAMSNLNLKIEDGNPVAVALRTHFAQHCFISHMDLLIGGGKAGICNVGNVIENVRFFGGDYGIYTTKTAPGWPLMILDTHFSGQKYAAIKTEEVGLTAVRMRAEETPIVVEIAENRHERLFMEDCQFINIGESLVVVGISNNVLTQINLRNIGCKEVATVLSHQLEGNFVNAEADIFRIKELVYGLQIDDGKRSGEFKATYSIEQCEDLTGFPETDLPAVPPLETWVNIRDLGAVGDGKADDTAVIQQAIKEYKTIYFPQGQYVVSETLVLEQATNLIGLHPIGTQVVLQDNTGSFAGFGAPKALLETPKNGQNIVSGIALNSGARNPRAVACKWMAGVGSYMNDVKFVGGHGSMLPDVEWVPVYNADRTADANPELKWDVQYWSLWVTDGGGGIFKNIWTASPYAAAGLYVSDTATPGRIYSMSVEHHVRNEVVFRNVANWRMYALQLEEEVAESSHCLPLELINCENLSFMTLYLFRVIWIENPYPHSIKVWNSHGLEFLNVFNFAQTKYPTTNTLFDIDRNWLVRPWEMAKLLLQGETKDVNSKKRRTCQDSQPKKLADGFEFADAICADNEGNVYFCDSNLKRVYRWDRAKRRLTLAFAGHFKPLLLAFDSQGNLLIVCEYFPPVGAVLDGKPEVYAKPPDAAGTSFGYWYNTGSTIKVLAGDPKNLTTSQEVLEATAYGQRPLKVFYPANRWRDSHDFLQISMAQAVRHYVAPDGVTLIADCYDLIRANALLGAVPGKPFYAIDEYNKRTIKFEVTESGTLCNPTIFAERGQFSVTSDDQDNVYIADDRIYVYNRSGELINVIETQERPVSLLFSGKSLLFTSRASLYELEFR